MTKYLVLLSVLLAQNYLVHCGGNVVCFYSNWAIGRHESGRYTLNDVPGDKCTHIVYGFVGFSQSSEFQVNSLRPEDDNEPNGIKEFSRLKSKFPNVKLIVSIGGWDAGGKDFSEMVALRERRRTFITSVVRLLKDYNLDGFNFMWLWPAEYSRGGTASDKDNFSYLLEEMKRSFKDKYELSATVTIEPFRLRVGYHISDICESVDGVYLMTYDLRGDWFKKADIHTPMTARPWDEGENAKFTVSGGVEAWINDGCPANKVHMGIATLGRTYTLEDTNNNNVNAPASSAGSPGPSTGASSYMSYYEICDNLNSGWTRKIETIGKAPYAYKGDQWVGYDDSSSLTHKLNYMKEKNLGGIFFFALDMDDFKGVCGPKFPLLNVVSEAVANIQTLNEGIEFTFTRGRSSIK